MIASLIESTVSDAGYVVVGPATRLTDAVALASNAAISAALLDIQLDDGMYSYPVANILVERKIPFAFVSSHPVTQVDTAYRDRPYLRKPFESEALLELVHTLVGEPGHTTGAAI